jgi:uncharacterized MAPEG superfamily protein
MILPVHLVAISCIIYYVQGISEVVPPALLQKSGYELALSFCGLPAAVMALIILSIGMTRILTGSGDVTKARTNEFLITSNKALRNHFEQSFMFAVNLIAYAIHGNPEAVVIFALVFTFSRVVFWFGYIVQAFYQTPHLRRIVTWGTLLSAYLMYKNALYIFWGVEATEK